MRLVAVLVALAAFALHVQPASAMERPNAILVGDSVTHISSTDGLLEPYVDAVNGRAMVVDALSDNGLLAITALRESGYAPRRWIVELGLNDLAYQTHDVGVLRARIRMLVVATGGKTYGSVYWVVPYVDPTRRAVLASYVPNLIAALHLVGFGSSTLVRWDHVAAPSDTYDGVHPTPAGAAKYSALLNRAASQP